MKAGLIFDTYIKAENGDYSRLAMMSAAYDFMLLKMLFWGDLTIKGGSADGDPNRNYAVYIDPKDSVICSPLSKLLLEYTSYNKTKIKRIPEKYQKLNYVETPTLLISWSIDFSTPKECATNELIPYFKNGKQVVLKEMGHVDDILSLQHKALENLVTKYYKNGNIDSSLFKCNSINFKFSFSFGFSLEQNL